jgi:hypothetical protein
MYARRLGYIRGLERNDTISCRYEGLKIYIHKNERYSHGSFPNPMRRLPNHENTVVVTRNMGSGPLGSCLIVEKAHVAEGRKGGKEGGRTGGESREGPHSTII